MRIERYARSGEGCSAARWPQLDSVPIRSVAKVARCTIQALCTNCRNIEVTAKLLLDQSDEAIGKGVDFVPSRELVIETHVRRTAFFVGDRSHDATRPPAVPGVLDRAGKVADQLWPPIDPAKIILRD